MTDKQIPGVRRVHPTHKLQYLKCVLALLDERLPTDEPGVGQLSTRQWAKQLALCVNDVIWDKGDELERDFKPMAETRVDAYTTIMMLVAITAELWTAGDPPPITLDTKATGSGVRQITAGWLRAYIAAASISIQAIAAPLPADKDMLDFASDEDGERVREACLGLIAIFVDVTMYRYGEAAQTAAQSGN